LKFLSLRWKLSGILFFSNIILGAMLIIFIRQMISESLSRELIERGRTIGVDLAQYSAEQILENDVIGLRELITGNLNFESVEYILIHNSEGGLIAHNYSSQIPSELLVTSTPEADSLKAPSLIHLESVNLSCFDIWIPVEDGYLGYIRVGMKENYVAESIEKTITVVILVISGIIVLGIIVVLFLANRIINPILYLTSRAGEISQGKLGDKVIVKTGDEIEQLGLALERLRESMKIALERLKKHQSMRV